MENISEEKATFLRARRVVTSNLLESFTHQAKNDLFAISGLAELALDNPEIPEDIKKYLRTIKQNSNDLQISSRKLLDYSRSEDVSEASEVMPLSYCAEEALALANATSLLQDREVALRFSPQTPVRGNKNLFMTLFLIVLGEIAKDNDRIDISITRSAPWAISHFSYISNLKANGLFSQSETLDLLTYLQGTISTTKNGIDISFPLAI
jgi:signal transduction histidine kinase